MIGLSPPARYSVILIDCTRGSAAACSMNASVDVAKLSYGWCTMIARSRITETIGRSASRPTEIRPGVIGGHARSLRSGRSRPWSCQRKSRLIGPRQPIHVVGMQVELAHEQLEHLIAHRVGDFEAHGAVEPAAAQLHLNGLEEVVGLLLLDREIGVASHAERRRLADHHPRKQAVEVGHDELLGGQIAALVDRHQTGEQVGHLDPGEAVLAGLGIANEHGDRQGEVGDVGEGMARVDRQRGEHGEDALLVDLGHRLAIGLGEIAPAHDGDAGSGQCRRQGVEEYLLLALDEAAGRLGDPSQLLRRRPPVGSGLLDASGDLVLQHGDANLKELVKVGRRDRTELGPLEQGDSGLGRQVQHALVERQPAQFAIDEPVVNHRSILARATPAAPWL